MNTLNNKWQTFSEVEINKKIFYFWVWEKDHSLFKLVPLVNCEYDCKLLKEIHMHLVVFFVLDENLLSFFIHNCTVKWDMRKNWQSDFLNIWLNGFCLYIRCKLNMHNVRWSGAVYKILVSVPVIFRSVKLMMKFKVHSFSLINLFIY